MKHLHKILFVLGLIFALLGASQSLKAQMANPLETDPSVWNSRELLVIWGEADQEQNISVKQAILGVNYTDYLQDGSAPFQTRVTEQLTPNSVLDPGVRPMAAQAGDYNFDGRDGVIYAVTESNKIKIAIPPISAIQNEDSTFSIQLSPAESFVEVQTGVNASFTFGRGIPLLAKGNFDSDEAEEFVLAARKSTGEIIVQIIDTDNGNTPNLRGANQSEMSVLDQYNTEVFDICTGDFDGDGKDEIALIFLKPNSTGSGDFTVFLRLFAVEGEGSTTLVEKGGQIIDDQLILPYDDGDNNISSTKVAVQAIKSPDIAADRILVSFGFSAYDQGAEQSNFYLKLMEAESDLSGASTLNEVNNMVNFEYFQNLKIKTGDMNGDGRDNAVVMVGNEFRVYDVAGDVLNLKAVSNEAVYQGDDPQYATDNFEVSDIDKNGRENILYTHTQRDQPSYGDRTLFIKSVELDTDYSPSTIIEKKIVAAEDYGLSQFYFGLTAGNFDGDDLKLGEPVVYECTYRRPLFILAPPPIHFDHINGVNYDESGCFTGSDCLFSASNTVTQSSSTNLKIQQKYDWSASATASAGYEGLYLSVNGSMTAKYGEQFEHQDYSGDDVSISVQHTVTIDDFIKGVHYPVTVYEYPVYNAKGDLINYVSAAFPDYQAAEDYEEQGKIDPQYIPYYEPGNLLSYPKIGDYSSFSLYDLDSSSVIYTGSTYTMTNNPGTSSSADISATSVYGTEGSQSWEGGVSTSLSASGFGIGVEVNGEYNQGGMKINSTEMSGTEDFTIRYDNIGGPSNFNAYSVKPYIFKTQEGTGMLAYQVNLASSSSSPTWWDINYGSKPDPALMLPQRNEVYWTSGAEPDNPIFSRSKSMTFNRLYPNVGDEVTVQCRVHNYSLKATSGPVKVSFYNGNPALGGEIVESLNGETIFETSGPIGARERAVVEMTFAMPLPVIPGESFVRFYAVIDPLEEYDEVHEDNNLGWQILGYDCDNQSGTTNIYEYYSREQFTEMWAWPNPTKDQVNLAFNMASANVAFLEIFDMQGKLVMVKELGNIPSGSQEVNIQLPASVAPGIYFIQLNSNGFRKTRKIMIQ